MDPVGTYEQVVFLALSGQADRAVLLGRQAMATAGTDAEVLVPYQHAVGLALGQLRRYDAALRLLAEADDRAGRVGHTGMQVVVRATAAWAEVRAGRHEEGLRTLARAHADLERLPPSTIAAVAASNLGLSATQLGLLDLGERWFRYGDEHADLLPGITRRCAQTGNYSVLDFEWGLVHEHAGRPEQARERYERCRAGGVRIGELAAGDPVEGAPWQLVSAVNRAACAAKLGEPDEARRLFGPVPEVVDTQTVLITRCAAHLGRAWLAVGTGDPEAARRHGTEAARLGDALGYARWQADAHRALAGAAALTGDEPTRAAHAARSADLLDELQWQSRLRRLGVSLGLPGRPR